MNVVTRALKFLGWVLCLLGSAVGGFPPPRLFESEPEAPPAIEMVVEILDSEDVEATEIAIAEADHTPHLRHEGHDPAKEPVPFKLLN